MIGLAFTVENINTVLLVYDQIQIIKYTGDDADQPDIPTNGVINSLIDWVPVSGTGDYPIPVVLQAGTTFYQTYDYDGNYNDWYSSRYFSTTLAAYSGWSDPILGETGDLYYDPEFPKEVVYGTADQRIIDRIRLYIGDPLDLRREYGPDAISSIHPDGKTYELDEKGWPVYITMGGKAFTDTLNPSVNGYKLLKFQEFIDDICTECVTYSGSCGDDITKEVVSGVDIWYYIFRNSDRQIMEQYDNCPPPAPLTISTATPEVYMLQTAIDLLRSELWNDSTNDGATIRDEGSVYDPGDGLAIRRSLLSDLLDKMDKLIKSLQLTGITGVLID